MFDSLSETQKTIVFDKCGKVVVRACPGSGKTYSVAARLAHKLKAWNNPNAGIAVLSFTNVAWEEIEEKLADNFNLSRLVYPHFLGTIDSFINNYIFLPHGHLVMGTNRRPVLVGEPHGTWSVKRYQTDYDQYFDIVSYGINEELLYPEIQGVFYFGYSKIFKNNGEESQHGANLRNMKQKYWKLGYANQHDANYFALCILEKYPQIAKALSFRFPQIILDEAQDTNDVQMKILDILCEQGLQEIMLVGDPDQAIFEWNKARPKLFKDKYELWKENSIILNDNRRSSQVICNATFPLSTLDHISVAANETVKDFEVAPEVVIFDNNDIQKTVNEFLERCTQLDIEITPKNVAVLCRSKNFINDILGHPNVENLIWTDDAKFTFPIINACFLYHHGLIKKAYKILETALYKLKHQVDIASRSEIERYIEKKGFINHRFSIYKMLNHLPAASGNLQQWVDSANALLPASSRKFSITDEAKHLDMENLFSLAEKELSFIDYSPGTVHSVKGETFEAVLLFLKTRGIGRNYTTLLRQNISPDDEEELRIVYVGITRPRKLLMIAVPDEANQKAWQQKISTN